MQECTTCPTGALDVTCTTGTKNVGDSATITTVINNIGLVDLPIGTRILMNIYAANPADDVFAEFITDQVAPPGSSLILDTTIPSVYDNWSGQSLDVRSRVYSPDIIADETCTGLLIVSSAAPSAEIVSMSVA